MKKSKTILTIVAVALAVFAVPAQGVIVGPYRLAFITSTDLGIPWDVSVNLDLADAHIQALATAAGLPGTDWKIIGSTTYVDARDHTGTNLAETGVPIYLVDGLTIVANNNAELWSGNIAHRIDQDEWGNAKVHWPFSGTYLDGTASDPTIHATHGGPLDTPSIAQGNGGSTTEWIWRTWTARPWPDSGDGKSYLPVYGISEVIPEPATICLLALGGLALLRKKR